MTISRRSLLRSGFAVSVASVAGAARAVPTPSPKKWDMETDVVIVGAGGGGLAAAVVAAYQTKLNVVVLEKEPIVGGSSTMCGGMYSTYDTAEQRARGIKDSRELLLNDMIKVGKGKNDKEVVEAFIDSGKIFYEEILCKLLGLKPHEIDAAAGMSVRRGHTYIPSDVIKAMYQYLKSKNVPVILNCPAQRLTWNDAEQCIDGVLAKRKGKDFYIHAKKGVILASGGFARNPKLLEKYVPLMANVSPEGGLGNTGDGLLMAMAYGADVLDTAYIKATHGYRIGKQYGPQTTHSYYGGAILVNSDGKRFVNESLSYKLLADAALSQREGKSFAVFDENIRQARKKARLVEKGILEPLDNGGEVQYCLRGNTLEEAAQKAGLNPKVVKETVDKYNKGIEANEDEFSRTTLTGGYGKPVKIENGPFFIFPVEPRLIATYCGIRINPKAQVIDVFGNPINKLYAAGEVTGGVHGAAYMSGTAFGKALAFGRIAILDIANQK